MKKAVIGDSSGQGPSRRWAQVWTWLGPEGLPGVSKAGPLGAPVLAHLRLVVPWACFPPVAARPDSVAGGSGSGKDLARRDTGGSKPPCLEGQ